MVCGEPRATLAPDRAVLAVRGRRAGGRTASSCRGVPAAAVRAVLLGGVVSTGSSRSVRSATASATFGRGREPRGRADVGRLGAAGEPAGGGGAGHAGPRG